MVTQYPHTLYIVGINNSTQNADGDFEKPLPGPEEFAGDCRAEANSEGRKFSGPDGITYIFQFAIYMKQPLLPLEAGMPIKVYNKAKETIFDGTIKRVHQGQLNFRIWV